MKRKTKEEIAKQAKEICKREDTECAIFVSGYIRGFEDCLKELENKQEQNG